ncbi:MAG: glycyl-radical enzyme activating protein [Desulfocapsaceae bacterium]
MNNGLPTFFDIKRYALHDGPNIRTTVFLKGCPLRCFWCHNPEGLDTSLEVVTVQERCIGCQECVDGCPEQALSWDGGIIRRDESLCSLCLNCVEICPSLAHEAVGYQASIDSIIGEIKKDLPFYDQSGGGVTFSGGEPLAQAGYLIELLQRCGELEIHRSVDTSGYAETDRLLEVAAHTDLFLFDLKIMDSALHEKYTGVGNEQILQNLEVLSKSTTEIRIRFPLVGTVNDSIENVETMGRFLSGLRSIENLDLLVYHDLAGAKYRKLQRPDLTGRAYTVTPEIVARTKRLLEQYGLTVHLER